MNPLFLNLSDSETARFVRHTSFLKEISILCDIPQDVDYVKVTGIIDFERVVFDELFYNAIKGEIDILDLSDLKSSGSYSFLGLGLNNGRPYDKNWENIKEIILPDELNNMPMIRNLPWLRKIVGLGLTTFNNENKTDYWSGSNLSGCPKLEEIVFGRSIKKITIRNSSIKRLNIPESDGGVQLEAYGLAYNNELEEVHIPKNIRELPVRLFEGCKKLRTITGGNSLEGIGFGAFGGCTSLHCVPFRLELLKENQFISYDEWMQYEPNDHQSIPGERGKGYCSHCPKGRWSETRKEWINGCGFERDSCRDSDQLSWKPYKKGVVLRNGYIWCFNDFSYYKSRITDVMWSELRLVPMNMHKYVEFISPSITFVSEGDHVNINYNPQPKVAVELTFPNDMVAETIDFYFEDISYELLLDEMLRKVEKLDIDAIIDSYKTTFIHESFKMNSDTTGERYSLDRDAMYTDEYLMKLLPPIHECHDDETACLAKARKHVNPYKNKFIFGPSLSTFDKGGEDLYPPIIGPSSISKYAEDLKSKDAEIRKKARENYNRKDHVDYLVNCRISEIINKKIEIESKLHIRQAENDFQSK